MAKKFKFTQEDLDNMVLEALNVASETDKTKAQKPNILEKLLTQKQLNTRRIKW